MMGASGSTAMAAPPLRPFVHGVATRSTSEILAFEAAAGRFARSFTYYRSWGATDIDLGWERTSVQQLVRRGTTPVLTFQPQRPGGGLTQPAFCHARICAGDHDALLTQWGKMLAAAGGPVVVRLMHEGNGDWYPWCAGVNGNTPASYVAAWRHVRSVVRTAGATNTRWQWSMNRVYSRAAPTLASLYPGDDVVDEVGLSGYNGGAVVERGGWRSGETIFGDTLAELDGITSCPRFIAETGCVERGGDKAAWIADLWRWLAGRHDVAGMTWFNMAKGTTDWRVETSSTAQRAYRSGALATVPPRF
jgi:hypothetical protein